MFQLVMICTDAALPATSFAGPLGHTRSAHHTHQFAPIHQSIHINTPITCSNTATSSLHTPQHQSLHQERPLSSCLRCSRIRKYLRRRGTIAAVSQPTIYLFCSVEAPSKAPQPTSRLRWLHTVMEQRSVMPACICDACCSAAAADNQLGRCL